MIAYAVVLPTPRIRATSRSVSSGSGSDCVCGSRSSPIAPIGFADGRLDDHGSIVAHCGYPDTETSSAAQPSCRASSMRARR